MYQYLQSFFAFFLNEIRCLLQKARSYKIQVLIMFTQNKQPQSHMFVVSQSRPIFIDTDEDQKTSSHINTIATIGKLPAFEPDNKLTKILYSKFLVKGVRPINCDLMLSKVKKRASGKEEAKTNKQGNCINKKNGSTERTNTHQRYKFEQNNDKEKGIFDIVINRNQSLTKFQKRPQTAFQRSQSSSQLNRPQSAFHTNSQKRLTRPTSVDRSSHKRNRSQTAVSRSSSKNILGNRFQVIDESENPLPIMTISDDNSNQLSKNFIEKNKRSASIKKINTYITDVEVNNTIPSKNKILQNMTKKHQVIQFPLHREGLTNAEKMKIKQKHMQHLNYLKKNSPHQYAECISYLCSLDQQGNKIDESIFNMGFQDQSFEPTSRELEEDSIKNFYQNLYNICIDVEYGIKKAQRKKKMVEKLSNILNIYQCQEIMQIYKEIQCLREQDKHFESQSERLKQLIKNLLFFRQLKPQIMKNMLEMHYRIQKTQENVMIIQEDQSIEKVYIILNGSVAKKNKDEENDLMKLQRGSVPEFYSTLFDGEIFGLPSKPQEKTLKYSVKTLEPCLLMVFPYKQYRKGLSSNQNIQDRIELLKEIFSSNQGSHRFMKQDYETVAFQMQGITFSAKQVIYREGQPCEKLIIVANGKVSLCFQSILTRKKIKTNSLLKKRNQVIPSFKISDFRRKNLTNYEVIYQNSEEIIYYFSEIIQEKIRGDVLNWQGFHKKLFDQENSHLISYSLISSHDNTKIYQLSTDKLESFPPHIRAAIIDQATSHCNAHALKRNQKDIQKWQNYKQNFINTILREKTKR